MNTAHHYARTHIKHPTHAKKAHIPKEPWQVIQSSIHHLSSIRSHQPCSALECPSLGRSAGPVLLVLVYCLTGSNGVAYLNPTHTHEYAYILHAYASNGRTCWAGESKERVAKKP